MQPCESDRDEPLNCGLGLEAAGCGVAASVLLLAATTLSVYKPRGTTRYGQRKQYEERAVPAAIDAASFKELRSQAPD